MGRLAEAERNLVWGGAFGIANRPGWEDARANFRPAIFRPIRMKRLGNLALGVPIPGDPNASTRPWERRTWPSAAIVMPHPDVWQALKRQRPDDETVVLASFDDKIAMVGRLASADDVGTVECQRQPVAAHAMRLGPDRARFGLGLQDRRGIIRTPEYVDLTSGKLYDPAFPNPVVSLTEIGRPGSMYRHLAVS
jgi:hypothetical protein